MYGYLKESAMNISGCWMMPDIRKIVPIDKDGFPIRLGGKDVRNNKV